MWESHFFVVFDIKENLTSISENTSANREEFFNGDYDAKIHLVGVNFGFSF